MLNVVTPLDAIGVPEVEVVANARTPSGEGRALVAIECTRLCGVLFLLRSADDPTRSVAQIAATSDTTDLRETNQIATLAQASHDASCKPVLSIQSQN